MNQFIAKDILDQLSYKSTLGRSLKQISLRETSLENILNDIAKYRASYIDILVQKNLIGSRFKSDDSILRKYEKILCKGGGFKQCLMMCLDLDYTFQSTQQNIRKIFNLIYGVTDLCINIGMLKQVENFIKCIKQGKSEQKMILSKG